VKHNCRLYFPNLYLQFRDVTGCFIIKVKEVIFMKMVALYW